VFFGGGLAIPPTASGGVPAGLLIFDVWGRAFCAAGFGFGFCVASCGRFVGWKRSEAVEAEPMQTNREPTDSHKVDHFNQGQMLIYRHLSAAFEPMLHLDGHRFRRVC